MTPSDFEPPHIVLPTARHTHTIIALHGRGSQGPEVCQGKGLLENILQTNRPQFAEELLEQKTSSGRSLQEAFPSAKWVFPSSQERYSTVFQEELDEWFDIYSLTDPTAREELQVEGLHYSVEFLLNLMSGEARLVGQERIFLLGLSQGSATGKCLLLSGV